jgi:hypothetical protein
VHQAQADRPVDDGIERHEQKLHVYRKVGQEHAADSTLTKEASVSASFNLHKQALLI